MTPDHEPLPLSTSPPPPSITSTETAFVSPLTQTLLNTIPQLNDLFLRPQQPEQFLEEVIPALCKLSNLDNLNLFILLQGKTLTLPVACWKEAPPSNLEKEDLLAQIKTSDNIVQRAISTGQAQYTLPADNNTPAFQDLKHLEPGIATPLVINHKILGILHTFNLSQADLTSPNVTLFQTIANHLVFAMENTRLKVANKKLKAERGALRNRLAEVSTLFTLSQKIASTLNLNEVLDHLVHTIREVADCRACVIFLLDETGQYLEIKAAAGLKLRWKRAARLEVGQGASGKSVQEKRTIYIPDTQQDPEFIFFDRTVRSLMVVPLIYHDKAIGAINLDHTEPNAFVDTQELLLRIAATQAAIAIENALLFGQVSREEQRMRAIIQNMADGLLMIGPDDRIERVNPALCRLVGLAPAEIIGQHIYATNLDPRLKLICTPQIEPDQEAQNPPREFVLPDVMPETFLRVFTTSVIDTDGQVLGEVRVVHDVTKDHTLEQIKNDWLSTISHELRTPLFSIQGFVHLLQDQEDPPSPETQHEFLNIIDREIRQLTHLVTNLLDTNRLTSGLLEIKRQSVYLPTLINQTTAKMKGIARHKNLTLLTELPDALPTIEGDPQRLEQVLTNLIGNAIKFTPEGGKVTLLVTTEPDYILLKVTDTGIGISETDLAHIFDKYYQAKTPSQTKPGSGLGLFISKQLIEAHQGRLWAESQPGQGTSFFIQLPTLKNNT